MKKFLFTLLLTATVVCADDLTPSARSSYSDSVRLEDKTRFTACENIGGTGFYWLNTETADLWRLEPSTMEWIYLGSPRGADSGRKGTYALLSDRQGGVYILNTDHGEGWWTDGTVWKIPGDPVRRIKRAE